MLASASATGQGKALAEVCTVYGVSVVSLAQHGDRAPAGDETSHHDGAQCALGTLGAFATLKPLAQLRVAHAQGEWVLTPQRAPSQALDACAAWVARLRHGPPALA
jgi:hypothetical protein